MTEKHKYAQVIVDVPELDTRTFSYLIPEEIYDFVKPGIPVIVPFGNRGAVNAFVVGFTNYMPEGIKAKEIFEILNNEPLFDLEFLQLLEWVSNYYCCSLQTVIDAAIPSNLFSKSKRIVYLLNKDVSEFKLNSDQKRIFDFMLEKTKFNVSTLKKRTKIPYSKFYTALRQLKNNGIVEIKDDLEEKKSGPKLEKYIKLNSDFAKEDLTPRRKKIFEALESIGEEIKLSDFLEIAKTTALTIKKLAETAAIQIYDKEIFRNPSDIFKKDENNKFFKLTASQEQALDQIKAYMRNNDPEPVLLYGITGSGKTEVYMHAVKEALSQDKSVIILAPEILLASQLAMRFAERFGAENTAIWHSSISEGERFDVWNRLISKEIRIIIGARSAIFAPVKNLGLIIIDEEHESSYKQTTPSPRYNAKTIAAQRAKKTGAALILGTATPDISTYFKAKNSGRIIKLPERIGTGGLAQVHVVDMREEIKRGNKSIFSIPLKNSLQEAFDDEKQAILLINRRGFSTYGQCSSCGFTPKCKSCEIPLILHKTGNKLRCHYCNYEIPTYDICPSCFNATLKYYGMGTQKVEELFKKEFPEISVQRMDSDIMSKKNAHIKVLEDFAKGETDVLIGTQMIAKGLDVPNVTLVGVISADSLFNIPDFRGTERGFQLLTQVAGRAGRGSFRGKVYFQTYEPEFFAVNQAKEQDFASFYNYEIQTRNEHSYPPFSDIIRLIISSKMEIKAIKFASDIAYRLKLITDQRGITERLEVLGPSRCMITKLKDEYRFHILIKNTLGENGHFIVNNLVKEIKIPQDIKFLIDVDPSDML
ncbi:MAG TPA: primosomal protein N' [Candidatus Gastranaerophilales bacterium]|nr:primosomal protein N' [Candidatus Gastranaerophilales bacterium]